jgi:hypothetical protein
MTKKDEKTKNKKVERPKIGAPGFYFNSNYCV